MGFKTGKKIKKSKTDLKLQGTRKDPRGNKKKKWVLLALEMMRDGISSSEIRKHITEHKEGSISETAINEIFSEVNSHLSENQFLKSSEQKAIHVKRYNNLIKKLLATEELDQDLIDSEEEGGISYEAWMRSREKKIKCYLQCIDTMNQKETLLQYHNKDFVVEININEKIEVKEVKPNYDAKKLTFDEQLELYEMIKLCKKDENTLISVSEVVKTEDIVTEDIEAEVVETANVEQIKQEELPVPAYVSPVTKFDPTILLRQRLKEIAAREIKNAGGNLTDQEKNYLKEEN